jgi:hypothetical protein
MKDQNTIKAEEKAQKILEILNCGANSKQWSELIELIKETKDNTFAAYVNKNLLED